MAPRKSGKNQSRARKLPSEELTSVAADSYTNVPARMGNGTPNLVNSGTYPLVRITQDYPLILSLYRSSWIVRRVIDTMANDMWKTFPTLVTDLDAEYVKTFNKVVRKTATLARIRTGQKWGRLFGGGAAVIIIEGHDDLMQPLSLDDVEVGSYKGMIALDRWSGIVPGPEINDDYTDPFSFGLPEYYSCVMSNGNVNIHSSRVLRFCGRELPEWERQVELYWGMSEVELIFDELRKRDYSSWNIVSLLTRAQLLAITEPQLAPMMSGASASNKSFNNYIERMSQLSEGLNNNGLMLLGKDAQLHQTQYGFGGVSQIYYEFMKDLAAACEIPYEIIFGRETGLGSNSEGSLQIYDNLINEKRISDCDPLMDKLIPIICQSTFGFVPDNLEHTWSPFRALSEEQRNNLARGATDAIIAAYNSDLLTKRESRTEMKRSSGVHGLFDSITLDAIQNTPDTYASETGMGEAQVPGEEGGDPSQEGEEPATDPNQQAAIPVEA